MKRLGPLLVLILLVAPLAVRAHAAGTVKRVAVLCPNRCEGPAYEVFRRGLRDNGWVEGQNLRLDSREAEGQLDRLRMLADELLDAGPDVMVAMTPQPVRVAKDATSTVPIVMVAVADPVLIGLVLVPSLARPGGNLTGVATLPGRGLIAKQLELLKELLPAASRIAVFWNSRNEIHRATLHEELPQTADKLGVKLHMSTSASSVRWSPHSTPPSAAGPTRCSSWAIPSPSRAPPGCPSSRSGHGFPRSTSPATPRSGED